MMTIKEASRMLGMGEQAVRTQMRTGKLPIGICIRSDRRWYYKVMDKWLDSFLEGKPIEIPEGMSDMEG